MIDSKRCAALVALLAVAVLGTPAQAQQSPPAQAPAQQNPAAEAPGRGAPPAPVRESPAPREGTVSLDVLLAQFAASSGKEILVDPRVRANVYVVPPVENPSYQKLLSILRIHGYMAIEIEGRINILPDAVARQVPTRLLQRDDRSVPDDEWITRVITVPAGEAPHLVPILRPMMPVAAHLAATQDGKLIIVDTYANVRRITELVNTLSR